jgi:hypothetical protein
MRAVKPLETDGYTKNDYVAYVSQSYTITSGSLTNTEYVTIDFADQPSDDWKYQQTSDFDLGYLNSSSGIYSYPLYSLLNRAFYSSQSIVEYGTASVAVNQFTPSQSLYVFNIANQSVGDGVKPGSFSVRVSGSSPILDDGYGRLYVNNTGSIVGNIFYKHGIAMVKNNKTAPSQSISTNGLKLAPFLPVDVNYTSSYTITQHTVVCKIRPTEFNASVFNHTIGYYKVVTGSYVSASQTITYTNYEPNISSSAVAQKYMVVNGTGSLVAGEALSELFDSGSLTPYVTTIGLYDKNYNLVAMAKLANPVPRTRNVDQTFIVKFDT